MVFTPLISVPYSAKEDDFHDVQPFPLAEPKQLFTQHARPAGNIYSEIDLQCQIGTRDGSGGGVIMQLSCSHIPTPLTMSQA